MHAAPSATLHAQMDTAGDGLVTLQPWCEILSNRQTADILKSRGIDETQVRERVPRRWCACGVSVGVGVGGYGFLKLHEFA